MKKTYLWLAFAAFLNTTATAQEANQYVSRTEYEALLKRIGEMEQKNTEQTNDPLQATQQEVDERDHQIMEDNDCGVIPIAGRQGFALQSKDGRFAFKPYMMVQTTANYNWYDDEGLDKAYNQDNVANTGFAIPYAIIGFTGKAFDRLSFNVSMNAAASGGNILQQGWIDTKVCDGLQIRAGKFKTPFTHAYLTMLGGTLLPCVPTSLTSGVIMPYTLNAVTPNIGTGFDLGVELHGLFAKQKMSYEIGVWNGTGSAVNSATKTFSDDWHIPSMLYAGRLALMSFGVMPSTQGDPKHLTDNKLLFAVSGGINVESEYESTNDRRFGLEAAWLYKRLYLAGEVYTMHVGFTERQKIDDQFDYLGGYAQVGYFLTDNLQGAFRYDFYNRNGWDANGYLNMPAVGLNYFINSCNLKLQAMYQYTGRTRHDTQLDRDNDDLGISTHKAVMLLQYSF
ncbi:MAG: porin [Paludibacteraceae bacterium]|nr:porin [Paludibacteraceae bacterium]